MKFQNPSMQGSEVMLCIKKRDGAQTNEAEAICPSNLSEVRGIIRKISVLSEGKRALSGASPEHIFVEK